MKFDEIRYMSKRIYANVPIDEIKVLNSRNRDKNDFKHNIRSIEEVGLLKAIVVNERYFKKNGYYDLVCGEGRLLAYKALNRTTIPAEIINCDRKQALLFSLVENIARVPPGTMWFAREVRRMHLDAGLSYGEISKITGYSESHIQGYIRLVEKGEGRLIKGVEDGLFPITFAVQVASSDNYAIQNLLMDAFDSGILNSKNIASVRKIIASRMEQRTEKPRTGKERAPSISPTYTLYQLKKDISNITKEKEAFVKEASLKENRLFMLLEGLKTLWQDSELVGLINSEGIGPKPELKGEYNAV